jgi:[acyl-carrier-protein] S-malonyltransferase
MAKEFLARQKELNEIFDVGSDISGLDLRELCFNGPMELLTETRHLQPAMTATVLTCARTLEDYDVIPSYVLGHSLGEFAALCFAHVITLSDCFTLVTERGRLMQEAADAFPGAMSAVSRIERSDLEKLVQTINEQQPLRIANYNTPKQLVISGSLQGIERAEKELQSMRARAVRLNVSGAWHSPLMKEAEAKFSALVEQIPFSAPRIPVVLNVTGNVSTDVEEIKGAMKRQMCSSVLWSDAILTVWKEDVRSFIEVGPKGVLAKMLPAIVPDPDVLASFCIDRPVALQSFLEEEE